MCGEKLSAIYKLEYNPGSPPRVRGKVAADSPPQRKHGITPACAGKSGAATPLTRNGSDHPRVCGEKDGRVFAGDGGAGSPPRVRGKVGITYGRSSALRITPACAGKSESVYNDVPYG